MNINFGLSGMSSNFGAPSTAPQQTCSDDGDEVVQFANNR